MGCFQVTEDGKEENYIVQVIRSKDGKISDVSKIWILTAKCQNLLSLLTLYEISLLGPALVVPTLVTALDLFSDASLMNLPIPVHKY